MIKLTREQALDLYKFIEDVRNQMSIEEEMDTNVSALQSMLSAAMVEADEICPDSH